MLDIDGGVFAWNLLVKHFSVGKLCRICDIVSTRIDTDMSEALPAIKSVSLYFWWGHQEISGKWHRAENYIRYNNT